MSPLSDSRLPDWLQGVSLSPDDAELELNRSRVSVIRGRISQREALDVFAFAYALPSDTGHGFSVAVDAVRGEIDESWAPGADSALVRRLAAIAVADLLGDGADDGAAILAQAALSAEFCGFEAPLPDLPDLARGAVVRIGTERRRRKALTPQPLEDELEPVVRAMSVPEGAGDVSIESLRSVLAQVRSGFRTTMRRVQEIEDQTNSRNAMVDEELDVLWWAQGGASEWLGQPWSQSGEMATLVAPLEIAQLTHLQPPARSASSLIRAEIAAAGLGPDDTVSLEAAVNAAWKACPTGLVLHNGHRLFPILSALTECQKKSGDEAWVGGVKAEFGMDPMETYRRIDLSTQVLREMSLQALVPDEGRES